MNYQALNSANKARLVMTILESIDQPMEFDEFEETIGMMCENIPGLESQSAESLSAVVADCWEIFQLTALPYPGGQ
ncbi:MAG TPA: hypothetical protein VIF10_14405 [Methylobacter sp.]|jgi:hypothetical protein